MTERNRRAALVSAAFAAGLILAACNSGPSRSGTSPADKAAAAAGRKTEYLAGLAARRGEAGRVWSAITVALPGGVWLTEAACDAGKVRIKGRTASNNLLADYISRLGTSPFVANLALGGSVMKTVRGREIQEFSLTAAAAGPAEPAAASSLEDLEKDLPTRPEASAVLREVQRLAVDSGFRMTKFTPGAETAGEFASAIPVAVEVTGERVSLGAYLDAWNGLPGLWIIDKFSLKAVSADDPRSPIVVAITARAYFRP